MSELVEFDISDEAAMRVGDDPVIQALMKNVDRAAIRENLKLTPEQRLLKLQARVQSVKAKPFVAFELRETFTPPPPPLDIAFEDAIDDPLLLAQHDPVIQAYMAGIDRTLIRENLKRTHAERLLNFQNFMNDIEQIRADGQAWRASQRTK
jgi:hypothetical protein